LCEPCSPAQDRRSHDAAGRRNHRCRQGARRMTPIACSAIASGALAIVALPSFAAESEVAGVPKISGSVSASYYALPGETDFTVGVASLNRDALHLEARYNYEALNSTSLFAGWKFAGGEALTWEITPIAGALFGRTHALIPGVELSVAYRQIDAYV